MRGIKTFAQNVPREFDIINTRCIGNKRDEREFAKKMKGRERTAITDAHISSLQSASEYIYIRI